MVTQETITEYWERETCGTRFASSTEVLDRSREITAARYRVEPFIASFARFDAQPGMRVLEVGVGAGTDFMQWLRTGADCFGIDATAAAIELTQARIVAEGCPQPRSLTVANASALSFEASFFDIVYSYGVIHHAEDTKGCLREIGRVLKPGGQARVMVYAHRSATGLMLWVLHGLLRLRPLVSQRTLVAKHLESPGTKSYSREELTDLVEGAGMSVISMEKRAGPGDLLLMPPSEKYASKAHLWGFVSKVYPRRLVRRFEKSLGLFLLVTAQRAD